jgi:ribonuclease BN (tRNA processing enzyme)
MRVTVLGGCGAWPAAGEACSGYLVEHDGFRVLLDPGYATLPRLLALMPAEAVDAVLVTHGHPDHCADLNPLLRARELGDASPPPLPVYSLPGALDAVLALDRPGMLAAAYTLHEIVGGKRFAVGPFDVDTRLLPHFVPNVGMRLAAGGRAVMYTGDTGPSPDVVALARRVDLLIAEATYVDEVPTADAAYLSTARIAGRQGAQAGVGRLMLTHLWPGTDHGAAEEAARREYDGVIEVTTVGVSVDLD